uniref:Sulfotransferase n=1 Tax=Prolemur simus TaxID=1328070 RepID=A0A8C8ZP34_PROSS
MALRGTDYSSPFTADDVDSTACGCRPSAAGRWRRSPTSPCGPATCGSSPTPSPELTSPRLIKSHLPYRFLPSDLHNGDSKVIYMARNPKDLVVSYYQFHRSLRTMSYRGTFQEFCRRFMNDKLGYGSWFEHVQEFWEHRMDSNVLFLKYEDMHRDLVTMVEQLARFLGVSCDKAQLESLIEHCHQLVDQCCNAEALPVGRGRVGLWKDIFTVSMNEKFDLVYKQKMGKCDLTFDFYL